MMLCTPHSHNNDNRADIRRNGVENSAVIKTLHVRNKYFTMKEANRSVYCFWNLLKVEYLYSAITFLPMCV